MVIWCLKRPTGETLCALLSAHSCAHLLTQWLSLPTYFSVPPELRSWISTSGLSEISTNECKLILLLDWPLYWHSVFQWPDPPHAKQSLERCLGVTPEWCCITPWGTRLKPGVDDTVDLLGYGHALAFDLRSLSAFTLRDALASALYIRFLSSLSDGNGFASYSVTTRHQSSDGFASCTSFPPVADHIHG